MASFSQQQQQRAMSPHRTVVWTEPKKKKKKEKEKVAVVYYLCREDGQLEHPHFMEVPVGCSSSDLCLRDFTERLDMIRGKGMSAMYSWSSKRSYRNQGFVWHDLTDDDIIHPIHVPNKAMGNSNEYVLKGSHRFSSSFSSSIHIHPRRRNMSNNWSRSLDLDADYKQQQQQQQQQQHEEVEEEEISPPPPPSSSPDDEDTTGLRMRASSVLLQLISCGSHSQHKNKTASSPPSNDAHGGDRDYFSGSLLIDETNNTVSNNKALLLVLSLKRSSSCNADRRLHLESNKDLNKEATGSSLVARAFQDQN